MTSPPEPKRAMREADRGKPHLQLRHRDRATDRQMWTCGAIFGLTAYGRTLAEAYDTWVAVNAMNLDGPRGALRVRSRVLTWNARCLSQS